MKDKFNATPNKCNFRNFEKLVTKKKIEKLTSDLRLSVIVHQNYGHFRLKRLNC